MSDLAPSEDIVFDGTGGLGADQFVRAVRKAAFSLGRQKDDAWCAQFASTCLEGDALDFYEGLGEATQDSWKLLLNALLNRFRSTSQPSNAPVPAAAGPNTPDPPTSQKAVTSPKRDNALRAGVLRVVDTNSFTLGYFSTLRNRGSSCYAISKDTSKAMRIWLREGEYSEIFARAKDTEHLIHVIAEDGNGIMGPGLTCSTGLSLKGTGTWAHSRVWLACQDGTLDCGWPNPDQSRWILQPAINKRTGELRLFPDFDAVTIQTFKPARLMFEPVPLD